MEYVLGLDIGTTSVKVAIVEPESRRTIAVHSLPSNVSVLAIQRLLTSGNNQLMSLWVVITQATLRHAPALQDVHAILAAIDACIGALRLSPSDLARITRIGICEIGRAHV